MSGYVVSRAWQTDLERGTWYEVCHADKKGASGGPLIAGFVFVPASIPRLDFRQVDGSKASARKDTDLISGMQEALHTWLGGLPGMIDDRKVLYLLQGRETPGGKVNHGHVGSRHPGQGPRKVWRIQGPGQGRYWRYQRRALVS